MTDRPTDEAQITIRLANRCDEVALTRLAERDTHVLPEAPLLVAEVAGSMRAAISLADGATIADPFHRTAELVEMLRIRASAAPANGRPIRSRLRLALAMD